MRISKFKIKNYKIFEDLFEISFKDENITILLGTNNVGKSTILEALDLFLKLHAPKAEDFNVSRRGRNELFEFEMEVIDNEGNIVLLKSTYNEVGKNPKYYINGTSKTKNDFSVFMNENLTTPFYVSPDTKAEDNEKNIQLLFRETAKQLILENPENKKLFDSVCTNIDSLLKKASDSIQPSVDEISVKVKDDLNRIFGEELGNLDIKINNNSFNIDEYTGLLSSQLLFKKEKTEYPISSQGTGVRRASFISLLQNAMKDEKLIFKNNHILLIDEPEVFLHPMAVKELANLLYDIAGDKLQIVISTHSPIFVDLYKGLNTIIRILKIEDGITQLYSTKDDSFSDDDVQNIKALTLTNSYFNEFFFAKRILIVEGDSEYIIFNEAIKHYLKNEGYGKLPTHIINAKGKWTIPTIQNILNKFGVNYCVFHDLDSDKITDKNNLRQANERIFEMSTNNRNARIIANKNTLEYTLYKQRYSNNEKTKKAIDLISKLESLDKLDEVTIINDIVKWIYGEPVKLSSDIEIIVQ